MLPAACELAAGNLIGRIQASSGFSTLPAARPRLGRIQSALESSNISQHLYIQAAPLDSSLETKWLRTTLIAGIADRADIAGLAVKA